MIGPRGERTKGIKPMWILQDTEPMRDGVIGGDGAGESVSVRWMHENQQAAITIYWYSVDIRERSDYPISDKYYYEVERAIEWVMFESVDDIGGTATWSDIRYDNPYDAAYCTEADAETVAKAGAERDRREFISHIEWDGDSIPNL